jgi:hypothetical protein
MPVRDIRAAHVYDLLQSIAKRKTLLGDERKAEVLPILQHVCVSTLTRYSGGRLSGVAPTLFLASEEASYITGTALPVPGNDTG